MYGINVSTLRIPLVLVLAGDVGSTREKFTGVTVVPEFPCQGIYTVAYVFQSTKESEVEMEMNGALPNGSAHAVVTVPSNSFDGNGKLIIRGYAVL
jgi:hypothetical protein